MAAFEEGTFVRVMAGDENHGKLGIVVKPRLSDPQPRDREVWVEIAAPGPWDGVFRVLYHIAQLRVAEELDRNG